MTGELRRTLGTPQAVVVGLAAMLGAGVFYVWAPAAAAAGTGLLIGLLIAAVVATLNALSTTQLAMAHPVSGGAYAYGRHTIGPRMGFTAGWLFMVGKISSAGAIALIAGSYLAPDYARLIAVLAVVVLAGVNATGIRSTSRVSTLIVVTVLGGLLLIIAATLIRLPTLELHPLGGTLDIGANGWSGILQSAGLLFFSFAGYARMATLGEEVVDPRRTLPRAIILALAITLLIYGTIAILSVTVLGIPALAQSTSPVADLVSDGWDTVIRTIAAIACLGSLMGVLAGLSRTGLAMARNKDLPGPLSVISSRTNAPIVAELSIAALAIAGIVFLDPLRLVAFSSCAVLGYYAIAHASALRQPARERWLPRLVQVVGLLACVLLIVTLPWQAVVGTAVVLVVGFIARAVPRRLHA